LAGWGFLSDGFAVNVAHGYCVAAPLDGSAGLLRDEVREFGEIYAHGIATNTTVIELLLNYCHEHGVTSRRLGLDQVFAAGTLDS
jgi:hypothetical protein